MPRWIACGRKPKSCTRAAKPSPICPACCGHRDPCSPAPPVLPAGQPSSGSTETTTLTLTPFEGQVNEQIYRFAFRDPRVMSAPGDGRRHPDHPPWAVLHGGGFQMKIAIQVLAILA